MSKRGIETTNQTASAAGCFGPILHYVAVKEVAVRIRGPFLSLLIAVWSSLNSAAQQATVAQGQMLTFRVAGSTLSDVSGASVGNIEALTIDPQSGRVMFAMVSTGFPQNRTALTAIPWPFIQHRTDARAAGGLPGTFQQFAVPFSQQMVRSAPRIDSQAMASMSDASWMTAAQNYFAPLAAAGGINAAAGTQTGAGAFVADPNVPAAATGFIPTNSMAPTNARFGITNPAALRTATNAVLPGANQQGLPAGTLPPGTVPANTLPAGTLPAEALPPGTTPNGASLPPVDPGAPRKVPLSPPGPTAPAK